MRKLLIQTLMLLNLAVPIAWASAGDAAVVDHATWDRLLQSHVSSINGGKSTVVDYAAMQEDRQTLKGYLSALAAVTEARFEQWPQADQLAFLINAYNAWTVELILTEWPDLESIKDLGGFFSSPWRKAFIPLLGKTLSLDDIEHDMIRGSGRYNEPRIHFAVNCASIGCPPLRTEAYVGSQLDQQLEQQTRLFLSDRSRNRVVDETIQLSPIFKWYRDDFERGWDSFHQLESFLLAYSEALGIPNSMTKRLKNGDVDIEFLDYDWRLNNK